MREARKGKNNRAAVKRLVIHPDGTEHLCHGTFEQYCKNVIGINPSAFRGWHKKGKKYKGFSYKNLDN